MFGTQHALAGECALLSREEFTSAHIRRFFGMTKIQMQSTKVHRLKLLHETFLRMAEAGIAEFFKGEDDSVFGFYKICVVEFAAWSRELVACGNALESNKETTYPKNKVYDLFQMCGIKPVWRGLAYAQKRWTFAWERAGKQELTFSFLSRLPADNMREGQYVNMQERLEDRKLNKKNMGARVWMFDRARFERQKDRAEVGAGKKRVQAPDKTESAVNSTVSPLQMLCTVALNPSAQGSPENKKAKLQAASEHSTHHVHDDTSPSVHSDIRSAEAVLHNKQLSNFQSAHRTPQKSSNDVHDGAAGESVSGISDMFDSTSDMITYMQKFYSKARDGQIETSECARTAGGQEVDKGKMMAWMGQFVACPRHRDPTETENFGSPVAANDALRLMDNAIASHLTNSTVSSGVSGAQLSNAATHGSKLQAADAAIAFAEPKPAEDTVPADSEAARAAADILVGLT